MLKELGKQLFQLIYYIQYKSHQPNIRTTPKRSAYGHTPHKPQERPPARINNTNKNLTTIDLQSMKTQGGNSVKKFHKDNKSVCNARSSFRDTKYSTVHILTKNCPRARVRRAISQTFTQHGHTARNLP